MKNTAPESVSSVHPTLPGHLGATALKLITLRAVNRYRVAVLLAVVAALATVSYTTSSASSAGGPFGGRAPSASATVKPSSARRVAPAIKTQVHTSAKGGQDGEHSKTDLNIARKGHTATRLGDGRILIVGGENAGGQVQDSELYDPQRRAFSLGAKLDVARAEHTATRLANGRILIAGGHNRDGSLRSTELFDPATNEFSRGPRLTRARSGHTATVLADGRILIAGGDAQGTAEIFDPATMKFDRLGSRTTVARSSHSAILLRSGKVLIAGGLSSGGAELSSGEIFDPATLQFSVTRNSMRVARTRPTLRELPDGKVQVIGGDDERSMEMFNAGGEYFTARARLVPDSPSEANIGEVLRTQTRAALINNRAPLNQQSGESTLRARQFPMLEDLFSRSESLADLLDRSEHTITEIPETGTALITGGKSSSGMTLMSSTTTPDSPATVTTDKTDYAPGETVIISGTGWMAGETVELTLHRDNDTPDTVLNAVANDSGNISNSEYVVQESDLNAVFLLTALGQTSGYTAQTTFTDSRMITSVTLNGGSTVSVAPGASITVVVNVTTDNGGGNQKWESTSWLIDATPPTQDCVDHANHDTSGTYSETFTITAPTTSGTYDASFIAYQNDTCGGQQPSNTFTLTNGVTVACAAPSISCPSPTSASADATCQAAIPDVVVGAVATGGCGPITVTQSPIAGTLVGVGLHTITVTATNTANQSATCTTTFTVNDITPPALTAGSIDACYTSVAAAEAAAIAATTATDNCSGAITTTASTVGDCSAAITVTATDNSGNSASVGYNTRIDGTPPTVTAGSIATCYTSQAAAEAAAIAATTATDNCPGAVTKSVSTAGDCSAIITVTATDGCGNAASVSYNTRIDGTPPTVTAGSIATCYTSQAAAEAAAIAATTATDNCGAVTKSASTVGACSATITVTGTDGCGNTASVSYDTRIDGTPPTVTAGSIGTCYPSQLAAEAAAIAATTATDNCGTVTKSASTVGTCSATITVTGTDGCGNTASVSYNTRIDGTPPTITCPSNVLFPCSGAATIVTYPPPVVTDNCDAAPSVVCNPPSGSSFAIGTTSVTCTATDSCGNSNACSFTVTVAYNFTGFFQPVDNTAPNVVKAGQSVPMKFQLMCGGSFISDLSVVTNIQSVNVVCDGGIEGDPIAADDSGASGLHYDFVANQFVYSWKTQKSWANTCRRFILTLNDGSVHVADFQFKK